MKNFFFKSLFSLSLLSTILNAHAGQVTSYCVQTEDQRSVIVTLSWEGDSPSKEFTFRMDRFNDSNCTDDENLPIIASGKLENLKTPGPFGTNTGILVFKTNLPYHLYRIENYSSGGEASFYVQPFAESINAPVYHLH